MSRQVRNFILSGYVLGLAACTGPLERAGTRELKELPPLPRALSIRVVCDRDAERFGSSEEWGRDLTRVLCDEVNVASAVWHSGERIASEADMRVTVNLSLTPGEPKGPEIDEANALLNCLAWLTIPVVSWFIADVRVHPGLDISLSLELLGEEVPPPEKVSVPGLAIQTSLWERHPLLSWETLGALVLPPFVFSSGDDDHMDSAIREEVRLEVAVEAAKIVKEWSLGDAELLTDLELRTEEDEPVLFCRRSPDLLTFTVQVDKSELEQRSETFPLPADGKISACRLPLHELDIRPETRLLRIKATDRKAKPTVLFYTVPINTASGAAREGR
jgi:hypothetical protein